MLQRIFLSLVLGFASGAALAHAGHGADGVVGLFHLLMSADHLPELLAVLAVLALVAGGLWAVLRRKASHDSR